MKIRFERRPEASSRWGNVAVPILAVVIALIVTTPLILILGANPLEVFYYLIISPFTSRFSLLEIFVEALPLILTGLAVTIAFTAKYWNIGGEGQLYAGALAAAALGVALEKFPPVIAIPLILVGGFGAGALWSLLCRLPRSRIDEAISTLLLNWVMLYLVGAILSGVWLDPVTRWPKSPEIAASARFPILIPDSRIHLGFIIALAAVGVIHWLLKETPLGFEIKTLGANPHAARVSGMNAPRLITIVAALSGGLAGLGGVLEVCGKQFHLTKELSPGYGYTGIIAATLGGLNPVGTLLAAVFLGTLNIGGQTMQQMTQTPVPLAKILQAVMLIVTVTLVPLTRYRVILVRGGKIWART